MTALQPIRTALMDGSVIMLVEACGAHVEARWVKAMHEGEVAWEGWIYNDALLADVQPLGPHAPTHWYLRPSTETVPEAAPSPIKPRKERKAKVKSLREQECDWAEWINRHGYYPESNSAFLKFPGTAAQAVSINRMNPAAELVGFDFVKTCDVSDDLAPFEWCEADYMSAKTEVTEHACPVFRLGSAPPFAIHPDGLAHTPNNFRNW